jgi:membrane-bound serine protease (ClpP class)
MLMSLWILLLLFIVGFIALFVELFVPAAGAIGAAGIICMIVATVLGYRNFGTTAGTLLLTGTLIGTPVMIVMGLKLFPKTFVGRLLILRRTQEREDGYTSFTEEKYEGLKGREGTAVTTLRPSGMVVIDEKKYSVVTSGEMIERGRPVRVIKVEGSRVVVRESDGRKSEDKGREKP